MKYNDCKNSNVNIFFMEIKGKAREVHVLKSLFDKIGTSPALKDDRSASRWTPRELLRLKSRAEFSRGYTSWLSVGWLDEYFSIKHSRSVQGSKVDESHARKDVFASTGGIFKDERCVNLYGVPRVNFGG